MDAYIPNERFYTYAEPFGGAASVLLYRDKFADREIYNDIDDRLVNVFAVVKERPQELKERFCYLLRARTIFNRMGPIRDDPEADPVDRAVAFLYRLTYSFGSKGESFVARVLDNGPEDKIDAVWERFRAVTIENKPFDELIPTLSRSDNFLYCDPPYIGSESVFRYRFFDHTKLSTCLRDYKGRWLLSYNDCPMVRELYSGFSTVEFSRHLYMENSHRRQNDDFGELLIANYDLAAVKEGKTAKTSQPTLW